MPIITCGKRQVNITQMDVVGSEYIKDVVKLADDVNVVIPIPDKYDSVIVNYDDYLQGKQVPITSRQHLLLCFQLSTLLVDDGYFKYCVQQTFSNWSYMCTMVYTDFNDDLQWSFFVYSPYDFIPNHLLNNNIFMAEWNKLNQNTITKVNSNEMYYSNYVVEDKFSPPHLKTIYIKTFHTVDNKEVGHKKIITYYPNNSSNVMTEEYYVDDKSEGPSIGWYNNNYNTLKYEHYYNNGKLEGLSRGWYDYDEGVQSQLITEQGQCHYALSYEIYHINGDKDGISKKWFNNNKNTLDHEEHYVNGKLEGVCKYWYGDNRHILKSELNYVDGKLEGTVRGWYNNDQHTLSYEQQYVNGKVHGSWKVWYDDDRQILKIEKQYVNGKLNGLLKKWYNNQQHTLEYEEHYVDDKLHGLSEMWYDDEQHTLSSRKYYVHDEPIGCWFEFDSNDDMTYN